MATEELPASGIMYTVPGGGSLLVAGLSVPADGVSGYSTGCLFLKLNGASGSTVYVNDGTMASADFNSLARV